VVLQDDEALPVLRHPERSEGSRSFPDVLRPRAARASFFLKKKGKTKCLAATGSPSATMKTRL
jgi:hypothetical protein